MIYKEPKFHMRCEKCDYIGLDEEFTNSDFRINKLPLYSCPKCKSTNNILVESVFERKKIEEEGKDASIWLATSIERYTNFPKLAEQAVKDIGIIYDKHKYWWLWDYHEFRWVEVDETDILNAIARRVPNSSNLIDKYIKSLFLEALKREGRLNKPKILDWHWIQFEDTLYNFKNGKIMMATPDYFVRNPIPWRKECQTETPELDKLLAEWLGADQDINILKDLFAWAIVPEYFISSVPFLYGNGSDGKSQFIKLLFKFIGIDNVTNTSLEYIENSQFGTYSLRNKLACVINEIPNNEIKKVTNVKAISGRDSIFIEKKGHDRVMEKVYSKILIVGNDVPICKDMSNGFARRIHLINFPNQFQDCGDVINRIPKNEFVNLASWCFKRLKELEKTHILTGDNLDLNSKRTKYMQISNQVNLFLKSRLVKKTNKHKDIIQVSELFPMYNEWAITENKQLLGYNEFKAKLSNAGVPSEMGYIKDNSGKDLHRLIAYGIKRQPAIQPQQLKILA